MATREQLCTVHFLCHASTAAARSADFPADEPLDEFGLRDCREIGRLRLSTGAKVWIAPERRTRQTAELLGLAGDIADILRDCDFGAWAGRSLEDVMAREPAELQAWLTNPNVIPGGGESQADILRRISAWLLSLLAQPGQHVAVTHPAIVRAALVFVLGGAAAGMRHVDISPLSSASILWNRQWRLRALRPWSKSEPPVLA